MCSEPKNKYGYDVVYYESDCGLVNKLLEAMLDFTEQHTVYKPKIGNASNKTWELTTNIDFLPELYLDGELVAYMTEEKDTIVVLSPKSITPHATNVLTFYSLKRSVKLESPADSGKVL